MCHAVIWGVYGEIQLETKNAYNTAVFQSKFGSAVF